MKRKGTLREPYGSKRDTRLDARHAKQKERRAASTISEKEFGQKKAARKRGRKSARRNRW